MKRDDEERYVLKFIEKHGFKKDCCSIKYDTDGFVENLSVEENKTGQKEIFEMDDIMFDIDIDMPEDAVKQWKKQTHDKNENMTFRFWSTEYNNMYQPENYGKVDIDNYFDKLNSIVDNMKNDLDKAMGEYRIVSDNDDDETDENDVPEGIVLDEEGEIDIKKLKNVLESYGFKINDLL